MRLDLMRKPKSDETIYRRGCFIRFIQYQQLLISLILALGFAVTAILVVYNNPQAFPFALFCLCFILGLLWLARSAYQVAQGNKLILSSIGIEYHYLGLRGFARWEDMLYFDEDTERAWLKSAYHTSDLRSVRINILSINSYISLTNKTVLGIRLNHQPKLYKSFLATLPKTNLDLLPLSLIVDIPRFKDGSLNLAKLAKTKLGCDLLNYAPHLFDKEEYEYLVSLREQANEEAANWYAEQEENNAHLFE
jgi:hypothetical protein